MTNGACLSVVPRILLTGLGAAIAGYGFWSATSAALWAAKNSWPPSTSGSLLGGVINIVAGAAIVYAAWRRLDGLAGILAGITITLSFLTFAPWLIRDTTPLRGIPGYHYVLGIFTGFGVPIIPLGYLLAAIVLRVRDKQRLGVTVWLAIATSVLVIVSYAVLFATAPST